MLAQELEIYKAADQLLHLALQVQAQVPRAYRMAVGQRIANECADILVMVARADIEAWLPATLGAHLNPAKTVLQPVARGIDFVGQVIKPWHRTTRRRTVASAVRRIEAMPAADVFTSGNSFLGVLRQASHHHTDQATIARALRLRGHAVAGDLTKIFRQGER